VSNRHQGLHSAPSDSNSDSNGDSNNDGGFCIASCVRTRTVLRPPWDADGARRVRQNCPDLAGAAGDRDPHVIDLFLSTESSSWRPRQKEIAGLPEWMFRRIEFHRESSSLIPSSLIPFRWLYKILRKILCGASCYARSWQQSDFISFVSGFAWDLPAGGFACWKLPSPNRIAL
jgi:hypothetical protein